jgi:YegS/Rv2252/BmrU family lipid kinase
LNQTLFIINPVSARGTTLRTWAAARRQLIELGFEFTEHTTSRAGEAVEIARDAISSGAGSVVAVGGDGTLNEVVNGYFDESGRAVNPSAAIGLLPSGTGSDFRRSIEINDWREAVRALVESKTRLIDAARITFTDANGKIAVRSFINMASFGLGGDVSALVNLWRYSLPRWIGGQARFAAAAISALKRFKNKSVTVEMDGKRTVEIISNLIVVANGRFAGGGMMLAPNAKLDDGLLDVILTDRATRLDVLKELPRISRGGYLKNPKVMELRAREVSIRSDEPMAIDIDGEMIGHTPARLTVLPAAVRFVMNEELEAGSWNKRGLKSAPGATYTA